MAGGAGVEYYFGYQYASSDLTCEDLRSRDNMWTQSKHALDFFSNFQVPFWNMTNANSRVTEGNFCLAEGNDDVIILYLPNGGMQSIDLSGANAYHIHWYDPVLGGELQIGSVTKVKPNPQQSLGSPPYSPGQDWVVRLKREVPESINAPTSQPTASLTEVPTLNKSSRPSTPPSASFFSQAPSQGMSDFVGPISSENTLSPTVANSNAPSSNKPSQILTDLPTGSPLNGPFGTASLQPSRSAFKQSLQPSNLPSNEPTSIMTDFPGTIFSKKTFSPTVAGSYTPSGQKPSQILTDVPTVSPSIVLSDTPSLQPSVRPSAIETSLQPSTPPTNKPISNIVTSGEIESQLDEGEDSRSGATRRFDFCRLLVTTVLSLSSISNVL